MFSRQSDAELMQRVATAMTGYLIRRLFQMILVILLVALSTYFLFNIAPGGPLTGIAAAAAAA